MQRRGVCVLLDAVAVCRKKERVAGRPAAAIRGAASY
jgi:hypothetical protein